MSRSASLLWLTLLPLASSISAAVIERYWQAVAKHMVSFVNLFSYESTLYSLPVTQHKALAAGRHVALHLLSLFDDPAVYTADLRAGVALLPMEIVMSGADKYPEVRLSVFGRGKR